MIWNRICLMLPTYGRSKTKLPQFVDSVLSCSAIPQRVCFSFCVNWQDFETKQYIENKFSYGESDFQIEVIEESLPKPHLAKFWNMIDEKSRFMDDRTMLSMVGDDMVFKTKNWDSLVLSWCNAFNGIGLFYGDDCHSAHESLAVNHFITRQFREAIKPLPYMCEHYGADMVDVIWHETAKRIGRLFYIPNLKIHHNHCAEGTNWDSTTARLRKELPDQKLIDATSEPYITQCVELMKKNLPAEEMKDENIDVIMTTKDRHELLRRTVSSYISSAATPKKIEVFDDNSKDKAAVVSQVSRIQSGFSVHWSNENLGANYKTPEVLAKKFGSGSKAVFIIDSDTMLSPYWWIRLNCMYRRVKNDKGFAALSLFHCDQFGEKISEHPSMVEQGAIGAFGSLITKEYYRNFIVPAINKDSTQCWDAQASLAAAAAGKKIFVSAPSFMQHLGHSEGAHVGGPHPAFSTDFVGEVDFTMEAELSTRQNKDVMFACFGSYGDCVHASFYANEIISRGFTLVWLTSPKLEPFVKMISPRTQTRIGGIQCPTIDYEYTDTARMVTQYPGFGYYVNAQMSAPSHRGAIVSMSHPAIEYMRKYFSKVMEIEFSVDIFSKVEFKAMAGHVSANTAGDSFIGFDSKSWREEDVMGIIDAHPESKIWLLRHGQTDGLSRQMRRRSLKCDSFVDCVTRLLFGREYFGRQSDLTWAAMLNRGMKKNIIHGDAEVMPIQFSEIDPLAIDVHASLLSKEKEAEVEAQIGAIQDQNGDTYSPKKFDRPLGENKKNVVSFSLWGADQGYIVGMKKNIPLVKKFYPGWICRIYCTPAIYEQLKTDDPDIELIVRDDDGWGGLFWRFEPACDSSLGRVMIRDADSRITMRERSAVDEWEKSRLPFHVMRDHGSHGVPICGGMWGIVPSEFPEFRMKFIQRPHEEAKWGSDQEWLQREVWPVIAKRTLAHDDWLRFPESTPRKFPTSRLNEFDFVGNKITSLDLPMHTILKGERIR